MFVVFTAGSQHLDMAYAQHVTFVQGMSRGEGMMA